MDAGNVEVVRSLLELHDIGVETVMVRYPREGHGFRETAHVVDCIERSLEWYRRHLGSSPESRRPFTTRAL